MCQEFQQKVQEVMSSAVSEATGFVRRMVSQESSGWGDEAEALRRIARDCKASFWTLYRIHKGKTKSVNEGLQERIRQSFIDHCKGHASRLLHEAEMAAAKDKKNDELEIIQDEIRALAARLEAAKGEAKGKMK